VLTVTRKHETGNVPSIREYYIWVADRCEELVVLNQVVIDAMTEAYMVKCHLETAKQNNETRTRMP
jgi:hypothetical protein